jgi:hypothetical protein
MRPRSVSANSRVETRLPMIGQAEFGKAGIETARPLCAAGEGVGAGRAGSWAAAAAGVESASKARTREAKVCFMPSLTDEPPASYKEAGGSVGGLRAGGLQPSS